MERMCTFDSKAVLGFSIKQKQQQYSIQRGEAPRVYVDRPRVWISLLLPCQQPKVDSKSNVLVTDDRKTVSRKLRCHPLVPPGPLRLTLDEVLPQLMLVGTRRRGKLCLGADVFEQRSSTCDREHLPGIVSVLK